MAIQPHPTNITVPIMTNTTPLPPSPKLENPKLEEPLAEPPHQEEAPYNATFENDLTAALLSPTPLPLSSDPSAPNEEPLPLTHPSRQFSISIPPITDPTALSIELRTTHPHGSIYGGPNPHLPLSPLPPASPSISAAVLAQCRALVWENGITTRKQVNDVLEKQLENLLAEVGSRARGREEARRANERVGAEMGVLREEFEMVRGGIMRNLGRS